MSNKSNIKTFIDLFAGCGGLSEGFMQTGKYNALAHVEWEMPMVNTLRNRLVKKWKYSEDEVVKRVIYFDIQNTKELINGNWEIDTERKYSINNHRDLSKEGLKGLIGDQKVDLIIGGPPCQAYSIAGRAQDKDSMKNDYRNYLFESFVEVVKNFTPDIFVFENVPGLLSSKPGNIPVTERIYNAFKDIEYEIRKPTDLKKAIYNSSDFGVPQNRKRIIIVGVSKRSKIDLEKVYKEIDAMKINIKPKNVSDAIAHLPKLVPIEEKNKIENLKVSHVLTSSKKIKHHEPRYHNKRDICIFKEWIEKNMNNSSTSKKLEFYNNIHNKNSNHAKYRNLEWDRPSPTIVAHLHKDGLMFIHPDINQARTITVKEAALLQSFPEDFEFAGSNGACFKMIGNAVPPLMAKNIGLALYNIL